MTAKEEFMFKQVLEKCNAALTDNALLVIEVNDLRQELQRCYGEISQLTSELCKELGIESTDLLANLEPVEIVEPKKVDSVKNTIKLPVRKPVVKKKKEANEK